MFKSACTVEAVCFCRLKHDLVYNISIDKGCGLRLDLVLRSVVNITLCSGAFRPFKDSAKHFKTFL